jgi:holin-like protein
MPMPKEPAHNAQQVVTPGLLQGLIVLFTALWLGIWLQKLLLPSIPGPVLGMVLLFGYLLWRADAPTGLAQVAQGLIKHLSLFFIPAATGIWFLDKEILQQWPGILMATIPATLLTQVLVALLLSRLLRR